MTRASTDNSERACEYRSRPYEAGVTYGYSTFRFGIKLIDLDGPSTQLL
jgi:hypothetical protein